MRLYHIEVNWIDYDPTLDTDIYEVIVFNDSKSKIVTSWKVAATNVGLTIAKYLT